MLIVSRVLLARKNEHGAWQKEGEKRGPADYVLVKGDDLRTVAKSVFTTALKLDIQNFLDMTSILRVLCSWAVVSPEEERVWEEKGSSNAPIFAAKLWAVRAKEGRRAEVRIYDNTVDLVLALAGYIRASKNELKEQLLADQVLDSPTIKKLVKSACAKTVKHIELHIKSDKREALLQREYQALHKLTWTAWASGYQGAPTAINIMALHDVYTWFDDELQWVDPWTHDAVGLELKKRLFKNKSTMRHNVGTLNEDSDWTARAREHDLPTWAGPSGTVHGLCWMLGEIVKVTPDELLACAYGLFAVWASPLYPKTATPIHHLFGVMTGAADYLPVQYKAAWQAESVYSFLEDFTAPRSSL